MSLHLRAVGLLALAAALLSTPAAAGEERLSQRLESMSLEERLEFLRTRSAAGEGGAEVDFQLGNAFFAMEVYDSALVYFERAVKADTSFAKAWVNMGLVYDAQRQYSAAQRSFEEALAIDPRDVLAICHLGFTRFTRGATSEAIDLYMKALAIDPGSAQAHYNLGLAFAESRIFREALREWEKVIELDDGDLARAAAENVELIRTYMELDQD